MVPTVRVGRFLDRAEAEVARGFLEAQGIEARVLADDVAGLRPDVAYGYGGVALAVHPDDEELARELLADADAEPRAPRARRGTVHRIVPLALALFVAVAWLLGSDAITGWAG